MPQSVLIESLGETWEFPDEATPDQIKGAIGRQLEGRKAPAVQAPQIDLNLIDPRPPGGGPSMSEIGRMGGSMIDPGDPREGAFAKALFTEAPGAAMTYVGNIARGAVADAAVGIRTLGETKQEAEKTSVESSGNLPAAIKGEPLPIDQALGDAAREAAQRGEFPTAAVVGQTSQGLAAMAPLAVVGFAPAMIQRLAALGFSADMIRHAPELFKDYADEINKPEAEQDPDKLAKLTSGIAQTFAFAPLAGKHGIGKGPTSPLNPSIGVRTPAEVAARTVFEEAAKAELPNELITISQQKTPEVVQLERANAPMTAKVVEGIQREKVAEVTPEAEKVSVETKTETEAPPLDVTTPVTESPAVEAEIVGMGGAIPAEFTPSPQTPTGIKNATVERERAARGLPPAVESARREFGEVWDRAMAEIDARPEAQDALIAELAERPRALTDVEDAMLLQRQIDLQNQYGRQTRELAQAFDDAQKFPDRMEAVETLRNEVQRTSNLLFELYEINKKAGTETGRGLNARKMMAREDFTLATMEMEARAAKGGQQLSSEEKTSVEQLQKKIETTQKAYEDYVAKVESERANRMTDEAIADLKRRAEAGFDPRIIQIAETIVGKLEKQAERARERLKEKFAQMGSSPDPTIIYDLGVLGAAKIARKGLDFAKWSAEMIADFGAKVQPYLEEAWKQSNAHLENEGAKYGDKAPQVRQLLRRNDEAGRRENITDGLKQAAKEKQPLDMVGEYVRKLAESFVRGGIKEREPLIDAVWDALKKDFDPNITRREAMDAISGYGKFKPLDKAQVKTELRDLRGQMQQVAKLEDIQAKKPLQKTGVERRTPSDEERRLIQQVNEAKRRYGVVVSDPARQLKSALDAAKTRLTNQINDLDFQIRTRQKTVKTKTPSPTDAEVVKLEARRDELRKQFDELFPKEPMTDVQRAQLAIKATQKQISDLEERIASKDISEKAKRKGVATPELEALRARREALNLELDELRQSDLGYQKAQEVKALEQRKAALEESVASLQKKVASGDIATTPKEVARPLPQELEVLTQQAEGLRVQLREMRKQADAPQKEINQRARQLQRLLRQIEEKKAKLDRGEIAPQAASRQVNRPAHPELEAAKQQLDEVNRQIAEARKTDEATQLAALKARIADSTARYQDRLARGDFSSSSKTKAEPPALDAEARRLQAENEIAKREWAKQRNEWRYQNFGRARKIWENTKEVMNLSRNVLTSLDLSAVGRQGGLLGAAHPLLAAKSAAPMLKAFASEKNAVIVEQQIKSRANYPLYERHKLYLAPHEALHITAMEEATASRWAGNVPVVKGSNRAYITFLNKLRADAFDTLKASAESRGVEMTPKELDGLANYINIVTGRGDMGKFGAAADLLALPFFSPRLVLSRFQYLLGQPMVKAGSWRMRKALAAEYARTLGTLAAFSALALGAGATIELDPRSSDFLKFKFGNTRVDAFSGLLQATVFLSKVVSGESKGADGEVRDAKLGDTVLNFGRSKLAPVPGAIADVIDIAHGDNPPAGHPATLKGVAWNMSLPMTLGDVKDAAEEQGIPKGVIFAMLSIIGYGVNTYENDRASATVRALFKDIPKDKRTEELEKAIKDAAERLRSDPSFTNTSPTAIQLRR